MTLPALRVAVRRVARGGAARVMVCTAALLAAGLGIVPAAAHGLVERSFPFANTALELPPDRVELWMSEPVDAAFSSVTVTDASGRRVSGATAVSPDGRHLSVPLEGVGRGFYTVRWRVLSRVDGHTTSGVFAFTVGMGARPPADFGGTDAPGRWLVAVRWLAFLATTLMAGAAFFPLLVVAPAVRRADPPFALALEAIAGDRLALVQTAAAIGVIATGCAELVVRAAELGGGAIGEAASGSRLWALLWTTNAGWSVLVRALMAGLMLLPPTPRGRILQTAGVAWVVALGAIVAMFGGPAALSGGSHLALVVLVAAVYGFASLVAAIVLPGIADFHMPRLPWVPTVAALVALAGLTLNAHAWGSGVVAVLFDWAHLAAAAVWIGGLACLLTVVVAAGPGDRLRFARALVPPFSTAAAGSLAVLVVTGAYAVWLHVPAARAVVETGYGRALGLKLLLLLPLVALGAANRFVLRRRIATGSAAAAPAAGRLVRVVGVETLLGAAVLLVAAALATTPPARTVATAESSRVALRLAGVADDLTAVLGVGPAAPGSNTFEATVVRRDGRPLENDARVLLRLTKVDEDLTPQTLTLARQDDGRYTAAGGVALAAGWWEARLIVRRRGVLDAEIVVPLLLGRSPVPPDPAAAGLLEAAREAMARVRTWREVEQITDGAGGAVRAEVDAVRPDRMRVRASGGAEIVYVGLRRYLRQSGGPWREEALAQPIVLEGVVQYLRGAQGAAFGREAVCDGEPCRAVLWHAPGESAFFTGWIGTVTHRLHRVLMVAPSHYMVGRAGDFNAEIRIEPPR